MNPEEKPIIQTYGHGFMQSDQTNAEITLEPLTSEVIRDIARNESSPRPWRKAAVKFLMLRKHSYQNHPDFAELRNEIKEETLAEQEVQAIVESATEEPLNE
jgi:hypothetical protein